MPAAGSADHAASRANAAKIDVDYVEFRLGDWLLPLQGERYALIRSNPPYIAQDGVHL